MLSGALVLVLLSYVVLPIAARHAVENALERHEIPASVEAVRISLLDRQVRLLDLQVGSTDGPHVSWGEVRMDVSLKALLQGRLQIHALQVWDVSLDLAVLSDPSWIRGLSTSGSLARELGVHVDDIEIRGLRLPGVTSRLRREAAG